MKNKDTMFRWLLIGGVAMVGLILLVSILKGRSQASSAAPTPTVAPQGTTPDATLATQPSVTLINNPAAINVSNAVSSAITGGSQSTTVTNPRSEGDGHEHWHPILVDGPGTGHRPPTPPPVIPMPTPTPPPPPHTPPLPVTPPPVQVHSQPYTVVWGDTLSKIASKYGMTWQQLYAANQGTINAWASQHGYPVSPNPADNIFPGEPLQVPLH